jgi:hypothetical protein
MAGDVQTVAALIDAGGRAGDKMNILDRFAQCPLLYATFLERPIVEYLIDKRGRARWMTTESRYSVGPLSPTIRA